jgi:hypothetical protein
MLINLKQLYKKTLAATDGEIGEVKDFYFDDQSWVVRYLVADTGAWLADRQVLISPHVCAIAHMDKVLKIKLTRKQIEASPSIDSHKPVSRQYEEDYYKHYGLPSYWLGDGLWGMGSFPTMEPHSKKTVNETATANLPRSNQADARLRGTQAVTGYNVQAGDGVVGQVSGFMMDERNWAIAELVVKVGHRFSGKDVLIATSQVDRVSYEESTVFVKLTKAEVEQSPLPHQAVD